MLLGCLGRAATADLVSVEDRQSFSFLSHYPRLVHLHAHDCLDCGDIKTSG